MLKFIVLGSTLLMTISSFARIEPWKGFSAPDIMVSNFKSSMSVLPLEGSLDINPKGWSGDYWASQNGGINYRWNHSNKTGFRYKSPSLSELRAMSTSEIAQLAPSEKYDILTGNYSYPLKEQAGRNSNPKAKDWAGLCHGWAPAVLHHNEPLPKELTNSDGIVVPFGSADIKALLSYYYAFYHDGESTNQTGLRCFYGPWMGGYRSCNEDLNAGAFHIVMTNRLGLMQKGFIADIDRYKEVWNQPIVGYKSIVLSDGLPPSRGAARSAVKEMLISTELSYVDESDPQWESVFGTEFQIISKLPLQYRIELNSNNEIVGGSWVSDKRPDFLWERARVREFTGILSRLGELLND